MALSPSSLVLLDTNVLVALARGRDLGMYINTEYRLSQRPERPLLSSIVSGEIWGLAKSWGWKATKRDQLDRILSELVYVSAGEAPIVNAYADLYAQVTSAGTPLGENDLWIAATAQAANATVLTTDTDFDRLPPNTVLVERIEPTVIQHVPPNDKTS